MAAVIKIARKGEDTFEVKVGAETERTHVVHLDPAYWRKITGGRVPGETLIEKSFEFLLERENNGSILSRFDLPAIGHYFPEFEKTIAAQLAERVKCGEERP
jgi:hypothetical protein